MSHNPGEVNPLRRIDGEGFVIVQMHIARKSFVVHRVERVRQSSTRTVKGKRTTVTLSTELHYYVWCTCVKQKLSFSSTLFFYIRKLSSHMALKVS